MSTTGLKIDARRQHIRERLERTGQVSVSQLSEELGTTAVTIRSDLAALEQEGMARRIPGGAVLSARLTPVGTGGNREEKQAIARAAAELIQNGDTLFLNAGTTTREVALALRNHRNLNVVTNSLAVATELSGLPTFRVILLGGELNTQYAFTCGGDAQEQLEKYQADYAVLSLDGVSAEYGITTYHADEAIIDRLMVERASKTLVAADHTKLGRAGFSLICPLEQVHTLVTDSGCDPAQVEIIRKTGVRVLLGV